ncbi:hypothetical protein D9M70_271170 [compost metagenome]
MLDDALDPAAALGALALAQVVFPGSRDQQVATRAELGITAGTQGATEVAEVTPGGQAQVARGLDACGAVGQVFAVLVALVISRLVGRHAALVDDIPAQRQGRHVLAGDDAALGVADAVGGQQLQAFAGLHQPAVAEVAGDHVEVGRGAQGAAVVQLAAADQGHVLALDQRAARRQAVPGLGQVEHRHQHLLALHLALFQPDDVVGQCRHLLGAEGHADAQVQRVLAGDGVVHQVAELRFVGGQAVEEALAGAGGDGLFDQALLVEAVAQSFLRSVRVVAQQAEQVVGAEELAQVGERRVGFDQVAVARVVAGLEQAVLPLRQAEARQGEGVDRLLGEVRRQLRVELDERGDAAARGSVVDPATAADVGEVRTDHAVVERFAGLQVDSAAGLDDGRVGLAVQGGRVDLPALQVFTLHLADEAAQVRLQRVRLGVRHVLVVEAAGGVAIVVVIGLAAGDEDPRHLHVAGGDAEVLDALEAGDEVAAGRQGAAPVAQLLATQVEVAPRHQPRGGAAGGDFQPVALDDLPDAEAPVVVAQVAVAARVVGTPAGKLGDHRAVLAEVVDLQDVAGVVEQRRPEAEVADAFQAGREVVDAAGQATLVVAGQVDGAEAVDIGKAVDQAVHPQGHVGAAEDQPVFVAQGRRLNAKRSSAAQGAVVVEHAGPHAKVAQHRQAAVVLQKPGDIDGAGPAPDDLRAGAQVQTGRPQPQFPQAAQHAIAAVGTGQGQVEVAVGADQAVVEPVAAAGAQALAGDQLAGGGLGELADVQGQAFGLQLAGVGPAGGVEVEFAVGEEAAAGRAEVGEGQVEGAGADMPDGAALVAQARAAQAQAGVADFHQAGVIVEAAAEGEGAAAAGAEGAQLAAGVAQVERGDAQRLSGLDQAAGIVQLTAKAQLDQPGADAAAAVVEAGGVEAQAVARAQPAGAVVDIALGDVQVAGPGGDAPAVVGQAVADGEDDPLGLQMTLGVVDALRVQRQRAALGLDHALAVVQPVGGKGQRAGAGQQLAAAVVERPVGAQREFTAIGLDGAALVVQAAGRDPESVSLGEDQPIVAVAHLAAGGDHQPAVAGQGAATVVQAGAGQVQVAPADQVPALVVQALGDEAGAAGRQQFGATVIERLQPGVQAALGENPPLVAQAAALDGQVGGGVGAAVRFDPGLEIATVDDALALDPHVAGGGQAPFDVQVVAGADAGAAAGIGAVAQGDVPRLEGEVAAGGGARQGQLAVGVDVDVARAGGQVAGQFHADARLGADQADGAGVHAAERRAVDGQRRLGAAVVGLGAGGEAGGVHLVAAGDDVQAVGVQLGVDPRAAGDQVELVEVAGVEAGALDGDVAAIDVVTAQPAVFHHRRAGGQGGVRRVEEAAAVAADAVRVGHDHCGRLPGHFGVALELAAVAAGDLVEDEAGAALLQVAVADDMAAQLRGDHALAAVVEDQPLLADVVVAESVVRQASGVGRGDVDDGHAVARLAEAGVAAGGRIEGQLGGAGDDRVEEQHAGDDLRDALEEGAANVHGVHSCEAGLWRGAGPAPLAKGEREVRRSG